MMRRTAIERRVEERAVFRCEYCLMHQSLQGGTFHIEHVTPESHGGATELENLALACPSCNLKKSNHIDAVDPDIGDRVRLFNPRTDRWVDHYAWQDVQLRPLTAIGRVTAALLDLNHPRRLRIRRAEAMFDLFPPIHE